MDLLEIENLKVKAGGKVILDNVGLKLKKGESYVLFGPNGSGKTTLLNAIMGMPSCEVVSGKIKFMGDDIIRKSAEERASLGISMGFQQPPEITGVKLSDLLKLCLGKNPKDDFSTEEKNLIENFRLTEFLGRDINVNFSGGERKRSEILQMIFLKPKLLLLDEPDSGVDVESLKLIGREIQRYTESTGSTALIVTHQGGILEHIKAEHACVLLKGRIHCYADPNEIYDMLKTKGYEECVECQKRVAEEWANCQENPN
jgi:Fe-S cluster assembly ATP-binding protein